MPKPVQDLLQQTQELQKNYKMLLTGTQLAQTLPFFDELLRRMITKLTYMGAVTEADDFKKPNDMFPPIILNDDDKNKLKVGKADMDPKEAEKKAFLFSVDKLYSELPGLNPHSIIQSYTMPEHQLIIRGVAKKAGVEDFDKKEITVAFLEEIILAIELKEEENDKIAGINAALKEEDEKKKADAEKLKKEQEQKNKQQPGKDDKK